MSAAKVAGRSGPRLVSPPEPSVEWADYPRIQPGVYRGYCRIAHWYRDSHFKRWTCLLVFDVFADGSETSLGLIPLWFNGGAGAKPRASRRCLYLPAWIKANGGPPARRNRLSPSVFTKRIAKIRVADTRGGPLPYTVVREIIEWETGGRA
jgi:hypothetical protein